MVPDPPQQDIDQRIRFQWTAFVRYLLEVMKARAKATPPSKVRTRKADDPEQYQRFREFAREHETDESEETFSDLANKIIRKKGIPATSQ